MLAVFLHGVVHSSRPSGIDSLESLSVTVSFGKWRYMPSSEVFGVLQRVDQIPMRTEKHHQELIVFGDELPRLRLLIELFQLVDVQSHHGVFCEVDLSSMSSDSR